MESTLLEQETDKQPVLNPSSDTVPWTLKQTILGLLITLLPWIAFTLILTSLNGTTSITTPISPRADVIGAIVTIVFSISVLNLNVQTNDQLILQESKVAPLTTYATLFAAVVIAPFCEEVFFRGFVFPGFRRGMFVGWAILLSSLLFGIAHADPGSFPVLFVIGIALAILRWRSRSLWPCILLHTLNNGIAALAIVLAMQGVIK